LYGKELTNKQIIEGQMRAPKAAEQSVSVLDKYSSRQMAGK
jgi:lipid-binding SYLF domain-containing protein